MGGNSSKVSNQSITSGKRRKLAILLANEASSNKHLHLELMLLVLQHLDLDKTDLWMCGYGGAHTLGFGDSHNHAHPKRLNVRTDYKRVSCAPTFNISLHTDGTLQGWGKYCPGFPGNTYKPRNCEGVQDLALDVCDIAVADRYCLIRDRKGSMYHWGKLKPDDTEIRDPEELTITESVTHIAAGGSHCLAVTEGNQLMSWGSNKHGQLGHDDTDDRAQPTPIKTQLDSDIIQICCSQTHSLAVTKGGYLWGWGAGDYYQCNPTKGDKHIPTQYPAMDGVVRAAAGLGFSMVIRTDGHLYTFGYAEYGQLGIGKFREVAHRPMRLPSPTNVCGIWAAPSHCAALSTDGSLYTWGDGTYGKLGHGNSKHFTKPHRVKDVQNVTNVSLGMRHTVMMCDV